MNLPRSIVFFSLCAFVIAPLSAQDRVRNGLVALYDFGAVSGDRVRDVGKVGKPLDLRIENLDRVARSAGRLEVRRPTLIRSDQPATKIIDAVKRSGELTIEAWIQPAKTAQAGPARIVSLSKDSVQRNFTLGQDNAVFDVRLRATKTSTNGLPSLATPGNSLQTAMTQVVYTRDRSGRTAVFLDGREVAIGKAAGNLANWDSSFRLALANELSKDRPWLGTYRLVAIYSRALRSSEVKQNFSATRSPEPAKPEKPAGPKLASGGKRVVRGIQLFYDFNEPSGDTVKDRAGVGEPLNLKIEKPTAVHRHPGSLEIRGETIIRSDKPPGRVIAAIRRSGELTIEAWITPAKQNQSGPARIVTLSKNGNERNFTLGHEQRAFDVRFRTNKTSANGIPSTASHRDDAKSRLTHVVYTRDRGGSARIFVDGRQTGQKSVAGSVSNWNDSFRFALGNEFSGDRQWRGTYHLVAIYDRDLSPREVNQNFQAGPEAGAEPPSEAMLAEQRNRTRAHFFETEIAPLLSKHCLECHDTASKEGNLDLSRKKMALAGGDSGDAIVPGKATDSLVWTSVEDDTMPHERDALSDKEKSLLRRWIDDGAYWSIDVIDPAIYTHGRGAELWVQRLTVPEYIETVRTAVGVDISKEAREILPPDTRADGFSNTAYSLNVDFEHVDAYAQLAERIVQKMDVDKYASQFTKKKRLIDDDMRGLIAEMGKWIFRGPLDEREVVDFRGITTTVVSAGGDFEEAVGYVIQAMLQSPRFVYRIENQRGDGAMQSIGEYELASRMSYILWGAPPDRELIRAAESGDLFDPQKVEQQVGRMLKDPRAMSRSAQFISQWLDLDRLDNLRPNKEMFPSWDAAIAADMREETLAYFHEVVWKQNRPLSDLLNAQVTFATPRLAKHYGMKSQGDGLARYDLKSVPSRGGLLTQGSLLTIGGDEASMVTRGLFVLNDLLFSEVGDPPPGLDTTPVPTSPGRTHRMIAMDRIESTACGGCHSRFEPLAFGLEKFDGLGTFHEVDEHGNKLRDDGEILFPGNAQPVKYQSSAELMDLLASSNRVGRCLTRKVTQFALGRPLVASDARIVRQIHERAQNDGGTYTATITAIVMSDLVQKTRTERP